MMATTAEPVSQTETVSIRYRGMDDWPSGEILQTLWEAQQDAVASVRPALPQIAAAAEAAALLLAAPDGRLGYAGAGTSARIAAQDAAELPPTFGWPEARTVLLLAGGAQALTVPAEGAEDDAGAGADAADAAALSGVDVLLAVAASGTTPFTLGCLTRAAQRGTLTVGVASVAGSPLLAAAAHPILLATGAEPVAGSTRLKGGTAQKVMLNLFSTLLMIRLGGVHDGMMVDMRPTNRKLQRRAQSIVQSIAGCDAATADAALAQSGGNVKRAVLRLRGADPAQLEELLARSGGSLRAALAALGA